MYSATTRDIFVSVEPTFLDDESEPDEAHFVWAYHVKIVNTGSEPVQLHARHWRITDSHGQTIEVRGEGVVGEKPILSPGETYKYSSGTPLKTPSGIMSGSYRMTGSSGDSFWVDIPAFSLDSPHEIRRIN